jgi:hypothetical protein
MKCRARSSRLTRNSRNSASHAGERRSGRTLVLALNDETDDQYES